MAEASLADRGRMQSMTFVHSTNQSTGPLNKRSLSLPSLKLGNHGGQKLTGTNTLRVLETRGWVPFMIAALEGEAPRKSGSEPTPGRLAQSTGPESDRLSTGHSQQNVTAKRPTGRSKVTEYGAALSARIPAVGNPEDRSAGITDSSIKSNYEASSKYVLPNRSSPRAFQGAGERSMNTRATSASHSQETRSQQSRDSYPAHSTSQASDINFGRDAMSLADAISRGDAGNAPQHAAMIVSAANHLLEAANKEIESNNDPRYHTEMKRLISAVKHVLPEFGSKAWISLESGNAPPLETAMEVFAILNTETSRLTDLGNFMKDNPTPQNPANDLRPAFGQVTESVLDTQRNLKRESLHLSSQESQEATPNLSAKGPIVPHYPSSELLHGFSIASDTDSSSMKEEGSLHMRGLSELDHNESPYVSAPEIPLVETLQGTTVEGATMFAKPEIISQNPKQATSPSTTSAESSFASKQHAVSPPQEATTRNPLQQVNPSTRRSHTRHPSDAMQDIVTTPIARNCQPWTRGPTDKTAGSVYQSIEAGNTGVATDVANTWAEEVQSLQDSFVWRPQTGSLPGDGAVETSEFSMTGNMSPAENIGVKSQNQQDLVRNRYHSTLDDPLSIKAEPLTDAGLRLRSQRRLEYNSIVPDGSNSIQTAGIGQAEPDRVAPFESQISTCKAHIKMKPPSEVAPLIPYNRTSKAITATDTVAEAIGKIPNPAVNSGPIFVVNWAPGGDLPSAQDVSAEQGTAAIRPQQHVAKLAAEQSELVKPSKAKHITEDFGITPAAESSLADGGVAPQASGGSNTVVVKNNPLDAHAPVVQQNSHPQQQNETEGESATVEVYDVYGTRKRLRFCPWISWRSDGGGRSRRPNRGGCAACCSCRTLTKGVCGTLLLGFLILLFFTNLVILNVSVVRDTIKMKSTLAAIVIPPGDGSTGVGTSSTTTRSSSPAASIAMSSMLPSDNSISTHLSESTAVSSTSFPTNMMSWTSSNINLSTSSSASLLSFTETTGSMSLSGGQSSTWSILAGTTSSTTFSSFSQSSSTVVASSTLLSTSSTSMLSATPSQSGSVFSTSPSYSGSTQQSTMSSRQSLTSEISSVSTSTPGLTTPSTSSSEIQTYTGWSVTSSTIPSSSVSTPQTAGGSFTFSSAFGSGSLSPTPSFSMSSSDISSSTTKMPSSTSSDILSSSVMSSYSEASMTSSGSITNSTTDTRISNSQPASSSESYVPTSTDILGYTQTSTSSQTQRNTVTETPTPTPTSSEVVSSESLSVTVTSSTTSSLSSTQAPTSSGTVSLTSQASMSTEYPPESSTGVSIMSAPLTSSDVASSTATSTSSERSSSSSGASTSSVVPSSSS
ncbi:hypothetical protein SpCBS45565_g06978, partial [Spizellomyces sp. 'palustris']